MLPPKSKRNIQRIIPFGIIWLLFSTVYTLLEKGLLGELPYYPATGNPYSFGRNLFITPLSALATGLLTGAIDTFYFNKRFEHIGFGRKILYKSITYLLILFCFLVALTAGANAVALKAGIFNKEVWLNV